MGGEGEKSWEKAARDAMNAAYASGQAPAPEAAALMICQSLANASRKTRDTRRAVMEICQGSMTALALNNANLAETAVQILKTLPNISLMSRSDPSEIMTWVLEGIAEVTTVAGFEARVAIQHAVDTEFHGVGEVFGKLCDAVKKRGDNPA